MQQSQIDVTWSEYVQMIRFTRRLTLLLLSVSVQRRENIAYNMKTDGQISMQFYVTLYLTWFCQSNKSGHIGLRPSTLGAIFVLFNYTNGGLRNDIVQVCACLGLTV